MSKPKEARMWDYVKRFGITWVRPDHKLSAKLLDQLDRCADDSCRRILLGIGEPFEGTREARG